MVGFNKMDPLTALREFTIANKLPQEVLTADNRKMFVFDNLAYPVKTKTNYKMYTAVSKNPKNLKNSVIPTEYYTLESLVYLYQNITLVHSAYMRLAVKENVPAIKRPDRLAIVNFLKGKTDLQGIANYIDEFFIDIDNPAVRITEEDEDSTIVSGIFAAMNKHKPENDANKLDGAEDEMERRRLEREKEMGLEDDNDKSKIQTTNQFDQLLNSVQSQNAEIALDSQFDQPTSPQMPAEDQTLLQGHSTVQHTDTTAFPDYPEDYGAKTPFMEIDDDHKLEDMKKMSLNDALDKSYKDQKKEKKKKKKDKKDKEKIKARKEDVYSKALGLDPSKLDDQFDGDQFDNNFDDELDKENQFDNMDMNDNFSMISHEVSYVSEMPTKKRQKGNDGTAYPTKSKDKKSDKSKIADLKNKILSKRKPGRDGDNNLISQREKNKYAEHLGISDSHNQHFSSNLKNNKFNNSGAAGRQQINNFDNNDQFAFDDFDNLDHQNFDEEADDEFNEDGTIKEDAILNFQASREQNWSTRHSILQHPTRNFKSVLTIVDNLSKEKKRAEQAKYPDSKFAYNANKPAQMSYSRYHQEKFVRADKTQYDGFRIEAGGGAGVKNRQSDPSMVGGRAGSEFQLPSATPVTPESQVGNSTSRQKKSESRKKKTPIIIIPAALTSKITTFNAKSLLEKYLFIESQKGRTTADAHERAGDFLITRKKINPNTNEESITQFRVVNNINKLDISDWDRVVCVFVQGPKWQFKGWPWLGGGEDDIAEIFQRCCAFHIKMKHMPLDKNIKKWSLQLIELEENARHQDSGKMRRAWDTLESWIAKNKPELRA